MQDLVQKIHASGPGAADDDIQAAEAALNGLFPQQYRELLALTNAPKIGKWRFFPIKDPKRISETRNDVTHQNLDPQSRWLSLPEDFVALAQDTSGNRLCFRLDQGRMAEHVYFCEQETGNIRLFARDLKEAIELLLKQ
jgi:hypothetical protein